MCKKRDIQGIMICDHNTTKGAKAFEKILPSNEDFIFIPGVEFLTDRGEIIGAWIEEDISTRNFPELADKIRDQGGMVIVPHPFDFFRRSSFKLEGSELEKLDAIEVFNSRCFIPGANKKAARFAETHTLGQTVGSDAHFSPEVGRAWISFNGSTQDEFRKAVINGNITVGGKRAPSIIPLYSFTHRLKRAFRSSSM
jgi:predicted metal-dependent phosphoesterase TrpH